MAVAEQMFKLAEVEAEGAAFNRRVFVATEEEGLAEEIRRDYPTFE